MIEDLRVGFLFGLWSGLCVHPSVSICALCDTDAGAWTQQKIPILMGISYCIFFWGDRFRLCVQRSVVPFSLLPVLCCLTFNVHVVSTMLKLPHAAVMVRTGWTSSLTQSVKSWPKSIGLQKSSGENLLAFATAILCRLMAGKLI